MAKNWPAEKSSWEVRRSQQRGFYFSSSASPTDFVLAAAPANYYIAPRWTRTSWETSGECSHVHTRDTTEKEKECIHDPSIYQQS